MTNSTHTTVKDRLRMLWCQHKWIKLGNPIELASALKNMPALTQIKTRSKKIFFDRQIIIFECEKCGKLKFWKS